MIERARLLKNDSMRSTVKSMYMPFVIAAAMMAAIAAGTGVLILGTSFRVYKGTNTCAVQPLAEVPRDTYAWLGEKKIFFGHQSVGYDIVHGIEDLLASHEALNLNIVETKDPSRFEGPMFAHARVGRNFDPESKIAEFRSLMENGVGDKVDIAFFKLCFVDIGINSDPQKVFDVYCDTMAALKSRFPDVVFVHVTVPLCGRPGSPKGILKATVKRVIGRPPVLDENLARARFNTFMRERFSDKEPLFDLALCEAIGPDGVERYGRKNGQEVPVLVRAYTYDGGHLNRAGRQYIAEQLLIELLRHSGESN